MGTFLDYPAAVNDNYPVGILNGGKPVGYYEAGSIFHQLVHCLLNQLFGSCIHRGGCLIQNQNLLV